MIVGEGSIRAAVELIVDNGPGRLLAQYVLQQMMSEVGARIAYKIYQTQREDRLRAYWAVRLIITIGHPDALHWIPPVLADPDKDIALLGMDILDRLIQGDARWWLDDTDIENVLELASQHPLLPIRTRAAASRFLLQEDLDDVTRQTHYLYLIETAEEQNSDLTHKLL